MDFSSLSEFNKLLGNPAEIRIDDPESPLAGQIVGTILNYEVLDQEICRIKLVPIAFPKNTSDKLKLEVLSMQLSLTILAKQSFRKQILAEQSYNKIINTFEAYKNGHTELNKLLADAMEQDPIEINPEVIEHLNILRSG